MTQRVKEGLKYGRSLLARCSQKDYTVRGDGSVKHHRFIRRIGGLVVVATALAACAPPPPAPKKPEIARFVPPPAPPPPAEEPEEIAVATVRDADRVVAALRPQFRVCYERGRRERPRISGRMMLVANVRDDGTVKSARVRDVRGLPQMVTECVARQMRGAKFLPPGGAARLEVPVLFVRHE
jgi:hypothetical protein